MKKLIWFNMVTVDGLFEGPGHDITWHNTDDEFVEFAIEQLNSVDTLIFGRVTYELMANFWPSAEAKKMDPLTADKMNSLPKIVFSQTLDTAEWNNTTLKRELTREGVMSLKQAPGKDLIVFGSSNLASALINMGSIDEYRLMINPVILGAGSPLLKDLIRSTGLKLARTRIFKNGNVLLCYHDKAGQGL
jgi:dihydrofolate reductase